MLLLQRQLKDEHTEHFDMEDIIIGLQFNNTFYFSLFFSLELRLSSLLKLCVSILTFSVNTPGKKSEIFLKTFSFLKQDASARIMVKNKSLIIDSGPLGHRLVELKSAHHCEFI